MDIFGRYGIRGRVRERLSDDSIGPGISGINIIFSGLTSEPLDLLKSDTRFRKIKKTITTDSRGYYRISLDRGVYTYIAIHPKYIMYCNSKLIPLIDVGFKTINIFLKKKSVTTIYVIRHAEYDIVSGIPNQDLPLNADGVARKEQLTKVLCKANVNAIFSTNFVRTQETAQELADIRNINMIIYPTVPDLIQQIKSNHVGENILVVGHSNTVPIIIKELVPESTITNIYNEFHNLFVVSLCGLDSDKASVANLWYGNAPECIN